MAGIWESTLPLSLLWLRQQSSTFAWGPTTARRPEVSRAPSWSWASIDGALVSLLANVAKKEVATYISCNIHLTNDDTAFGQVSGGSLRIKGPLASFESQDLDVVDDGRGFAFIVGSTTGRSSTTGRYLPDLRIYCDEGKEATAQLLAGALTIQYLAIRLDRGRDEY